MKLLILNGPNLNLLGRREPDIYGKEDYPALCRYIEACATTAGIAVKIVQSNHEGVLVDEIQEALGNFDGIVINPAAYTHTSIAILDALKAVALPVVEVHLSNPQERESFRYVSYAGMACLTTFAGLGFASYAKAIAYLTDYLNNQNGSSPLL